MVVTSLLTGVSGAEGTEDRIQVTLINELNADISVYWEGDEKRHLQGEIDPKGGEIVVNADRGHVFSYDHDNERHFIRIPTEEETDQDSLSEVFILHGGKDEVDVFCTVSINGGEVKSVPLRLILRPSWAPRGVSRFMQLVRAKYFDGVALNRVIPGFLAQFGIGKHLGQRFEYSELRIRDDEDMGIKFEPGMISFAKNSENSRSTEVFIVMPDVSEDQLNFFGTNSWETPFGYVTGNLHDSPLNFIAPTGDVPPHGEGPDPHKIYAPDGYEYLAKEFPNMDYINTCFLPWEREEVSTGEEL